jgi:hypothetical protein
MKTKYQMVWSWEDGQELKAKIGLDAFVMVDVLGRTYVVWSE